MNKLYFGVFFGKKKYLDQFPWRENSKFFMFYHFNFKIFCQIGSKNSNIDYNIFLYFEFKKLFFLYKKGGLEQCDVCRVVIDECHHQVDLDGKKVYK